MPVSWPGNVPSELERNTWSRQPIDSVVRTPMSAGPPKTRPRSTITRYTIRGSIVMSETELAAFETFYETDLANGSLTFDFPDPLDPDTTVSVKFAAPYAASNVDGELYRLSLVVETQP